MVFILFYAHPHFLRKGPFLNITTTFNHFLRVIAIHDWVLTLVLVVLNRDGSDGYEEDSSDQVDEELQDGEVGAQQVGHQHCRHDDGVPVH